MKRRNCYAIKPGVEPYKLRWVFLACIALNSSLVAIVFALTWKFGFRAEMVLYTTVASFFLNRTIIYKMLGLVKIGANGEHTHVDYRGILVKCYHTSTSVLRQPGFWIGLTIGYPFEHFLYEKVWPFYLIQPLMGH